MIKACIFTLITFRILNASDACTSSCSQTTNQAQVCASNGKVYQSLCHAQCESNDLYTLAFCENSSSSANASQSPCASQCQKAFELYSCLTQCSPQRNKGLLFCGSNGEPYNCICRARCYDSNVVSIFDCAAMGIGKNYLCNPKCRINLKCKNTCQNETQSYTCGHDGLIYGSMCEINCNGLQMVTAMQGNSSDDIQACGQAALKMFGPYIQNLGRPTKPTS